MLPKTDCIFLVIVSLILFVSCKTETSQPIENGTYEFTLMFSEFMNRDQDRSCEVIIDGFNILIQQNSKTSLNGNKVLEKGTLMLHDSGKWIIGKQEADKHAIEIGGCTDITVVDFNNKIVVWC